MEQPRGSGGTETSYRYPPVHRRIINYHIYRYPPAHRRIINYYIYRYPPAHRRIINYYIYRYPPAHRRLPSAVCGEFGDVRLFDVPTKISRRPTRLLGSRRSHRPSWQHFDGTQKPMALYSYGPIYLWPFIVMALYMALYIVVASWQHFDGTQKPELPCLFSEVVRTKVYGAPEPRSMGPQRQQHAPTPSTSVSNPQQLSCRRGPESLLSLLSSPIWHLCCSLHFVVLHSVFWSAFHIVSSMVRALLVRRI